MPKVVLTSDITASPELLWQAIKSFSAVGSWHPLAHMIESEGDTVGSRRKISFEGAGEFVERLEELDDGERLYSYSIVDSPLPVKNCTVEVRVKDNGDGTSTVQWQSQFESTAQGEFTAVRAFQQLHQSALDNLQSRFCRKQ